MSRKPKTTIKQSHLNLVLAQLPGQDSAYLSVSGGKYASINRIGLRIPHEELVGAIEDQTEMGNLVIKVGVIALATLVNYPLAEGPEKLAEKLATWAGVDLEALKTALDHVAERKLEEQKAIAAEMTAKAQEQLELPLEPRE